MAALKTKRPQPPGRGHNPEKNRVNEAERLISQGQTRLARGDDRAALRLFDRALALKPDDPDWLRQRAAALTRLQQFELALRDLDRAAALRGDDPQIYDARGQLLTLAGRAEAALDDFRRALDLAPTADRHYHYGLTLSRLGRPGEALPHLERAVALEPRYVAAITERGAVRLAVGRLELAREDFDAALRVDPTYHVAWRQRAAYHYCRREWDEAAATATRAIELSPADAPAYKLRALAAKELGRVVEALADLERYFVLEPDQADRKRLRATHKQLLRATRTRAKWDWLAKLFGKG